MLAVLAAEEAQTLQRQQVAMLVHLEQMVLAAEEAEAEFAVRTHQRPELQAEMAEVELWQFGCT